MTLETLNIAHITKYIKDLPFQIDKSRLDAIKNSLENDIPIELEERFYYDTIANDIMKIANKKEGTTTAAFLIMQLPFVHTEMVSNYIEAVY
ncbi:MAG: hypothetical protein J6N72_00085, partial [Psychrobacter sp.]|nr:hypothetical protein [Psychrobacter sp.]